MTPAAEAELEELRRNLETALGHFNRAQEAVDAAVAAHAKSQALKAELADTRARMAVATKAYRDAVFTFVESSGNQQAPATAND